MTLQEILAAWLLSQLERHRPSFVGDNWIWDETGQTMTVKLEFERVALGAAQGASCWKVFVVRIKVIWGWLVPGEPVKVSGVLIVPEFPKCLMRVNTNQSFEFISRVS